MEKAKRIKESLEKALKQEKNCEKCQYKENHVTFSKDDAVIEEEMHEDKDDNYLFELNQISLNDADLEADLNNLEDLEPGEISE